MTTEIPTPSKEATAFAEEWLGIEHQNEEWDVGIVGGDTLQVGNYFYNLIDDVGDGPPRSVSERFGMEVEIQVAFAELLDQFFSYMTRRRDTATEPPPLGIWVLGITHDGWCEKAKLVKQEDDTMWWTGLGGWDVIHFPQWIIYPDPPAVQKYEVRS